MQTGDTIAAISSPAVPCARIILRLSGPRSFELVNQLVACELCRCRGCVRVDLEFDDLRVATVIYGFVAPHSYSGEDLIELHLPGNPWLCDRLLQTLLASGARLAEPGEFTARAYFNGRLDLTAAEGVAATVSAASEGASHAARCLLSGELSRRLEPVIDQLSQTLALIEVGIDFADEDVSVIDKNDCDRLIGDVDRQLEELLACSAQFERLAHEPTVALAGRPNAGKSTLLNQLSGHNRAVVSPLAGTTRDVIWTHVDLPRGRIKMTDAAGIEDAPPAMLQRHADEATGVAVHGQMRARALQSIADADVLVLLRALDDVLPPIELDRSIDLVVHTKADLQASPAADVDCGTNTNDDACLRVSAHTGQGMLLLRGLLDRKAFGAAEVDDTSAKRLALNARHLDCLRRTRDSLAAAKMITHAPELLAVELRIALDALGAICGHVTPDDLLGRIFSTFCIGK